jgi:hypothetical protein
MTKKNKTIIETVMNDDFKCKCGNTSYDSGFQPCDSKGKKMKPVSGFNYSVIPAAWEGHYKCEECNQIYLDK